MTLPKGWPATAALLLLALVPVGGALARLADLALPPTAESLRFHSAPVATALHAGGGMLFLILGPLQLLPGSRTGGWHARAGRIAWGAGLAAALSGLWMTQTFPLGEGGPTLLYGARMAAGAAWALFLILALAAIRGGDAARHRAFMLRALAIGFGAGTAALILLPLALLGAAGAPAVTLAQALAWAVNLAIAEIVIARAAPKGRPA